MKKMSLALIIAACSAPAIAESQGSIELLLGTAEQEPSVSGPDGTASVSGDDTSFGVRASFGLNQSLAFEVGYHVYGTLSESYVDGYGDTINNELSSDAVNLGVKGMVPLNDNFSLVGRIGVAIWGLEFRETDSAFPGEQFGMNDSGNDIYYGLGAQYELNSSTSIGLEYAVTEMDASFGEHKVENLSLSVGFKF